MKILPIHLFILLIFLTNTPARALENVIVSVAPLHSLVAGVMGDTGTPVLLLPPGSSPHSYSLRPSQAQALQDAAIVFRVSRGLETFLEKSLETVATNAEIVAVVETRGLTLLGYRTTNGEVISTGQTRLHEHDQDPHIWLDPVNAQKIVGAIAAALGAADRRNSATYRRNAVRMQARLEALNSDLSAALAPLIDVPFITFHDGFQYLEFRYKLNSAGFLTTSPDLPAGAGRMATIRTDIEAGKIACVFSEPQFNAQAIDTLIEGTDARHAVLDTLGADFNPGPELYFEMMAQNLAAITECLAP
jgi:zinc transport system substrate-binding protein